MTDAPGAEHYIAIGGAIVTGTLSLLAWASGSREGDLIADSEAKSFPRQIAAVSAGAGMIDRETYAAVIDGLETIGVRLTAIDAKLARLVDLGESQGERDAREQQHKDLRDAVRAMAEELRAEIERGDARRRAAPD